MPQIINIKIKGTVSVISSNLLFKELHPHEFIFQK